MPLGVVTEEEMNGEINRFNGIIKPSVPARSEKVIDINRGRPEGRKEVPESVRKLAADESICGTPAKEIKELLGVSQSSISAYKEGATSTSDLNQGKFDSKLKDHVEETKRTIGMTARERLMAALVQIDDERLGKATLREVSSVAKDLSAVSKNMESDKGMVANNQQVIVYAPRVKEEQDYQIITVNE